MASYNPVIKNSAAGAIFYVSLAPQTATGAWQANPTLAAGDVKIAVDDGAPSNLGTLPVVDADFTKRVKVTLSQAETNGDNLTVIFSDAAGAEWCDLTINIQTIAATGSPADVVGWLGTIPATPTVAGVPEVDLTHVNGAVQTATLDTIKTQTAAIEVDTAVIGALGAGLTAIPWNAAWDAEVESEVNDALVVHRLDELVNADSDIDGAAPPTVGSVFHELMSKTAGSFTFDQTTDSLEAVRDKLTDIETDTAEIGVAGAGLTNINLPNQTMDIVGNITGNLSGSVGSVTGSVGSVTGLTAANLDATISSRASQASVDDLPTNAELTTALGTADDAVLAQIALVKAKTDSLTYTLAGQVDANIQSVNDVAVTGTGAVGNEWGP